MVVGRSGIVVVCLLISCCCVVSRAVKMAEANCVFCSIINGDATDAKLYENERFIIINDIHPASDCHFLAIPKVHIPDARSLNRSHIDLVKEMRQQLGELFRSKGLADSKDVSYGFHWPPFISVKHLHLHGIGPVSKMSFASRYCVFQQSNLWYRSPEYVVAQLEKLP